MRKYKLDLVWGEFGDILLRDKRAGIQKRLEHLALPHGFAPRFEAIEMVQAEVEAAAVQAEFQVFGSKTWVSEGPEL